jgi:hypothetical protein
MRYTKPQILRIGKAMLSIQDSKAGPGIDTFQQLSVPSYTADE